MNDSQLTPEMIKAILSSPDQDPQALDVVRRQKMLDTMRMRSMGGVEPIQAGRRILPNYGGAIANVAQGMMAQKAQPGVDASMVDVNNRQAGTRQAYMQALMGALRRQPPPMPQMPPAGQPPAGPEMMDYGSP
jgi:hypothetical protein